MNTNQKDKKQKILSVILMFTMCVTLFSGFPMSGSHIAYGAEIDGGGTMTLIGSDDNGTVSGKNETPPDTAAFSYVNNIGGAAKTYTFNLTLSNTPNATQKQIKISLAEGILFEDYGESYNLFSENIEGGGKQGSRRIKALRQVWVSLEILRYEAENQVC